MNGDKYRFVNSISTAMISVTIYPNLEISPPNLHRLNYLHSRLLLVSTELQHVLPLLPHGYPEATGVVPIFKDVAGPLGGLLGRPGHLHYEQPNTVILLGSWCWQEGPRTRLVLLGNVSCCELTSLLCQTDWSANGQNSNCSGLGRLVKFLGFSLGNVVWLFVPQDIKDNISRWLSPTPGVHSAHRS